ncbi:MAG: glycerophosphodiester phosphodiesterase [Anaerolineae bacterium]
MPDKQKLTLIYAHRGARDIAPENTLVAFRAAIAAGADGVECDITRCATGEIVIIHDDTLDRTTDGSGKVLDTPFTDLRKLDAGAWFAKAFAKEHIPTLDELLDLAQNLIKVNIEIKGMSTQDDGIEAEVAEMVRQRAMQDSVIISSFNPWALKRMYQAAPELCCALLYTHGSPVNSALEWALPSLHLQAVHPVYTMVDQDYVDWAHKQGYLVNVWTVNELADMEKMIRLGVDGIITDHPALLRRLVADDFLTGRTS